MRVAVIDLGTNSVRCDIYELGPKSNRRIKRLREMIRMGDGVYTHGYIRGAVLKRTLTAFQKFAYHIKRERVVNTVAYGTSALRRSKNQTQVIQTILKKTGIYVQAISGKTESKLIANGITHYEYLTGGVYALVDIGGGSTEISFCKKQKVLKSYSVRLGANRLTQEFLSGSSPRRIDQHIKNIQKMRSAIRLKLRQRFSHNRHYKVANVLGSSGTIRSIKKLIKKQNKAVRPFRIEHLSHLVEWLSAIDKSDYPRIPGMELKRMDLILAGSVLFEEIMLFLNAKWAFHTEISLRNGIFVQEFLQKD